MRIMSLSNLDWMEALKVTYSLITYSNLCIFLFVNTVVLIIMDNNYKQCLCKQCKGHVTAACGSTCQLTVLSIYVFIFIAQCEAHQKRQSRAETLKISGYLSKCCLSAGALPGMIFNQKEEMWILEALTQLFRFSFSPEHPFRGNN